MGLGDHQRAEVLGAPDVADVVAVLGEAFFDYPVQRFVLGSEPGYAARLKVLVAFFVLARIWRDEVLLGARTPGGLMAAALVSYPGARESPAGLGRLRRETWATLGAEAQARYEAFGAATAPFVVDAPHLHLNMIGVRHSAQGQGLGRAVLETVHRLSEADESSKGVTLSTELESNVPLYEHFGYEVIGRATVASTLTTWVMYRRNRA